MLDVIIYEDDEISYNCNVKAINGVLANSDIDYHIYRINNGKIKENKNAKKIYIINVEGNNLGIEIALGIRKNNFNDIIIFTSRCDKHCYTVCNNKLMAFDYICKNNDYENRLKDDLDKAIKIIYEDAVFTFKYKRIFYRVPYENINYIEKESKIKRCIIHACDGEYYIVSSIDKLLDDLNNSFVKAHQSCIVNVDNIKIVDFANNEIVFKNDDVTCLLADKNKKVIKECIDN